MKGEKRIMVKREGTRAFLRVSANYKHAYKETGAGVQ